MAFVDIWAATHELLAEEFYFADPPRELDDDSRYTVAHAHRNVASTLRTLLRVESRSREWPAARQAAVAWAGADLGGFLAYAETSFARAIERLEQLDADDSDDALDRLTVVLAEVIRIRRPFVESEDRRAAAT